MESKQVEAVLDQHEILGPYADKTEEWREARRGGIGGSDVGVVLGMSKWKNPLELFNEKVFGPKDFSSLPAEIGSFLEPFLRNKLLQKEELDIVTRGCGMLPHKTIPFLFANPDDVAEGEHGWCVIEYKTTALHNRKQWKDNSVPKTYWAQVQLYMQVLRSHFGDEHFDHAQVVVLFGNRDIETRLVARDDYWFENTALPVLKNFWETVETGNSEIFWTVFTEQIDGSAETTKAINASFVPDERVEEVQDLSSDLDNLIANYAAAKEQYDLAKDMFDRFKNRIKFELKDVQKGDTGRYKVTWPLINGRRRFDQGAFKEKHPEMFDKFTTEGAAYRGALSIRER